MRFNNPLKSLIPLPAVFGVGLFAFATIASSQHLSTDAVKQGQKVFASNCSFCHGDAGVGHNAPRLVDRGFDAQYIEKVTTLGVKDTAMSPWGQLLSAADLGSVIAYVKSLNGIGTSASASTKLSGEAAKGRELFRDATRALGACSNCHMMDGRGINIVPVGKNIPAAASALRGLSAAHVKTVTVDDESFPALLASQSSDETKLYDLTTVPAVLRTFATSAVQVTGASTWQHAAVLGKAYSDQELNLVLEYLREAGKR